MVGFKSGSSLTTLAIEGGVCSGKTTVSSIVSSRLSAHAVPEYYRMLSTKDREKMYAMTPWQRYAWYVRLEYQRSKLIQRLCGTIVLDRSFLTLLATQYAFFRMGLTDAYIPANFSTDTPKIAPLDHVFFIELNYTERQRRWRQRDTDVTVQIFIDEQFNSLFSEFFSIISSYIRICYLSSDACSADKVAEQIIDFLERNPARQSITFDQISKLVFK